MLVTWHGHSTLALETNDTRFLVDPWFDNPKTSMGPRDIDPPDIVLVTHGHFDHIGDIDSFLDATIVSTPEITGYLEDEFGAEDTVGMNIGGTIEAGNAFVTMHRADHTNSVNMDYSLDAGMPTGFLVSETDPRTEGGDGLTFYHAGDTGLMSEMRDVIGAFLEPDAAALPVGDHFTMGPRQAAIAVEWLGLDVVIPIHYDSFPPIEIDTQDFVNAVEARSPDTQVHVLDADEPLDLTAVL